MSCLLSKYSAARVDFPKPDANAREKIWRQCLPKDAPIKDVNFRLLSRRLELTGGHIRQITVRAAFAAAGENAKAIEMRHLVHATRAELIKLGMSSFSKLNEYAPHIYRWDGTLIMAIQEAINQKLVDDAIQIYSHMNDPSHQRGAKLIIDYIYINDQYEKMETLLKNSKWQHDIPFILEKVIKSNEEKKLNLSNESKFRALAKIT